MSHNLPSRGAAQVSMIRTQLQQAQAYLKQGQFQAAQTACRAALAMDSRSAPALQMLGVSLAQQGDHDGAEAVFKQFLKVHPGSAAIHTNVGNIRLLKGDPAQAEAAYRKAIAMTPAYAEAHFNLGLALKAQDRLAEARDALNSALIHRPTYLDALLQLAIVLSTMGERVEAIDIFDKVLAQREDSFEAHFNKGLALVQLGSLEDAKRSLARAGSLNENEHRVFYILGQTLHRLQELGLATSALARAATLKPDDAETHTALAAVFLDDGWTMAALDEIEKSAKLDPDSAYMHIVKGRVLAELTRLDEAQEAHERAVEIAPNSLEALNALGTLYLSRGESTKAREVLERAYALHPDDHRPFLRLVRTEPFKSAQDPRIAKLEEVLAVEADMPLNDRVSLHYAAGQTFDELGQIDRAFDHFNKANGLQAEANKTPEEDHIAIYERIREMYTTQFIREREGSGSQSRVPIFVTGMPRSGTTLSEQIISSHPLVQGAGEVLDLDIAIRILANRLKLKLPMPDLVTELRAQDFVEFGDIYANRLVQRAPGTPHVTDKQLSNFHRIGLIHLALPNAKIIHCMRNPVDCCVSIYSNHFNQFVEHANDLSRLGRFYRRYHSLMEHWRDVLPAGSFLDVQYEDTVADVETQARRLIDFCGLEWDPRCLDFQNNKRQVTTLSITQVRQPIYKTSVERWRKYEKHLGPLLDALGDLAPPH